MKPHVLWLVEKILEFDPSLWTLSVEGHPDMTVDEWLGLRINWGIAQGFVWFEFDRHNMPLKAVCIRPVNEEMLERIQADYITSSWDFDSGGPIVFIDFRYGVGSIPIAWDLCRASGRKHVAYFHHQKLKRVNLEDVPRVPELLHG